MPATRSAIGPRTFAMARSTPRPPYLLGLPSRSSWASFAPVLAPDGTSARPHAPSLSVTSTSTVGFARESSTSLAVTCEIALICQPPNLSHSKPAHQVQVQPLGQQPCGQSAQARLDAYRISECGTP